MDGDWFRSGDVALVDDDGYVTIVDRIKDVIISGGENVYPAEVEDVIYGHPDVAECAVIGVPDERWGEVGRAIVVRRAGAALDERALLEHLDGRLARLQAAAVGRLHRPPAPQRRRQGAQGRAARRRSVPSDLPHDC